MARIRQSRTFRKILNNEEYDIENPELADAENMNIEDEIIGGATEDDLNKVAEDMEIATEEMDVNEQIANDVEEQIEANEQAIEEGNVTEEEARVSQECLQLAMRDLNMSESDISYLRFTTESINRDPKQVLVANNEALGGVWEKAKEMAKKAWEAIKKFFRKIIDFFKKLLPTRKNKLLKLQKILKDINGSSVHEDTQDEWDSVAEDKYMAFLNASNGKEKVSNINEDITNLIDQISVTTKNKSSILQNFIESLKNMNFNSESYIQTFNNEGEASEAAYNKLQKGFNASGKLQGAAYKAGIKANEFNEANYDRIEKAFIEAFKKFDKAQADEVNAFLNELKLYREHAAMLAKASEGKNEAELTLQEIKDQEDLGECTKEIISIAFPLKGSSYKTIAFYNLINLEKLLENKTKESFTTACDKLSKALTVTTSTLDCVKLLSKDELDKSRAKDQVDTELKCVDSASKKISKLDSTLTKTVNTIEKDIENLYKNDGIKDHPALSSVKKVVNAYLAMTRKHLSELVSAMNTLETLQYNYTITYATHTIKGIKKKETDKENNK